MNLSMRLSKDNFKPFQTSSTDINERFDPISKYHLFHLFVNSENSRNASFQYSFPQFGARRMEQEEARIAIRYPFPPLFSFRPFKEEDLKA